MSLWNIRRTFSASLVEERLRKFGKEGGYLTRKSNVKPGFFILSFIEKGKPVHKVAPNKVGKSFKQSFKVKWCSARSSVSILLAVYSRFEVMSVALFLSTNPLPLSRFCVYRAVSRNSVLCQRSASRS